MLFSPSFLCDTTTINIIIIISNITIIYLFIICTTFTKADSSSVSDVEKSFLFLYFRILVGDHLKDSEGSLEPKPWQCYQCPFLSNRYSPSS